MPVTVTNKVMRFPLVNLPCSYRPFSRINSFVFWLIPIEITLYVTYLRRAFIKWYEFHFNPSSAIRFLMYASRLSTNRHLEGLFLQIESFSLIWAFISFWVKLARNPAGVSSKLLIYASPLSFIQFIST
jgi:hypothetical protein